MRKELKIILCKIKYMRSELKFSYVFPYSLEDRIIDDMPHYLSGE